MNDQTGWASREFAVLALNLPISAKCHFCNATVAIHKGDLMQGKDLPSPCGCHNSWLVKWYKQEEIVSLIYHTPLPCEDGESVRIDGKVLHVGLRKGVPTAWFNAHDLESRAVTCVWTGVEFVMNGEYVGTLQTPSGLVCHYYVEEI